MKHIVIPDKRQRRLIFYLALEEYAAKELDIDEAFFLWQVPPTVIFGRNQLMETEVNTAYCREKGIKMFRRKSGGGCVYSDMGNIMLSYVTRGDNTAFLFDCYLRRIAFILQKIGVNATVSGRNDIMVDGRKISGNAFLKLPEKCIIHGTMLYDTDFEQMELAITPSTAKIESKGVASVRKHVANLKEFTDIGIEELKSVLIREMCRDEEYVLTADDMARVEEIEQTYLEESFFSGKNPAYTVTKNGKIPDAGEIEARIELKNGTIRSIALSGDFFPIGDYAEELNSRLRGVALERSAIEAALHDFDMSRYILNLSTPQFTDLILR